MRSRYCTQNLLVLNIRVVGRLGPVSDMEGRSEATGESGPEGRSEATAGSGAQGRSDSPRKRGSSEATGRPGARMLTDVVAYALARLLLVAVLTAVIFGAAHLLGIAEFPLVVALLFAIVIALPLGIWVFAPLRRRATASIAAFDERRRTDREQLRARLRGDEPTSE
jgi:uncharacterized protein DUF4229